jgi:predicted transcriptional regulator
MSAREAVIEVIRKLPEEATIDIDDIIEEVAFKASVHEGLRQLDAGKGIAHEDAMRQFKRWRN